MESKISKTFVDAIIEIQNNDTPLIVRNESIPGEKCMSCNQSVKGIAAVEEEEVGGGFNSENNNKTTSRKKNEIKKIPLNKLNNTSIKIGAGGYSNYLTNIDEKNIGSELTNLNGKKLNPSASAVLVKENKRSNSQGVRDETLTKSTKHNVNASQILFLQKNKNQHPNALPEELIGEYLRQEITNELGKAVIQPNNILRSANRAFQMSMQNKRNNNI